MVTLMDTVNRLVVLDPFFIARTFTLCHIQRSALQVHMGNFTGGLKGMFLISCGSLKCMVAFCFGHGTETYLWPNKHIRHKRHIFH